MVITTIADITGDGANHPISATSLAAKWVQIVAVSIASASSPARIGDINIGASQGAPLFQTGASQFFPEDSTAPGGFASPYDLAQIYYRAANNDKLSITYAI